MDCWQWEATWRRLEEKNVDEQKKKVYLCKLIISASAMLHADRIMNITII